MPKKVTVYRFRYPNRAGELLLSLDYATPQSIAELGGVIEEGSELEVDASDVSVTSGLMIVKKGVA